MRDKFKHTKDENIFLAKKLLVENVYCGIKMEGSKITFPETKTILNGVNVPHATIDDIQSILNMRDAWKYVLSDPDQTFNLEFVCKVNEHVARNESLEWGKLRTGTVGISGTDYKPELPNREKAVKWISNLLCKNISTTEKAIEYFLWGARSQLFWDGNKRTSLICANKIMISGRAGLLTISDRNMATFNHLLTEYYESADNAKIKLFLYETSIKGIERENMLQR